MARDDVLKQVGGVPGAPGASGSPRTPMPEPRRSIPPLTAEELFQPVLEPETAARMCGTTASQLGSGIGGRTTLILAQAVCTMVVEQRKQTRLLEQIAAGVR